MKTKLMIGLITLMLLGLAQPARAQWQNGNLALRTNGNVFQSGDQLRVEVVALEAITEAFSTQVVYAYTEPVEEKDEDGKVTTKQTERTRKRDTGPIIENFGKHQTLVLDDRFHFGDASPAGWYEIRVCIFQGYSGKLMTVLRTCVYHQNAGADVSSENYCGLYLRGIKRVNNEVFWTFDGWFNADARYSVLLMRSGRVLKHLIGGVYTSGERELNLNSIELDGAAGQSYDILLHDHQSGLSSTLARSVIPSAN